MPVLLLSGDADPITPPGYAELAAAELDNARSLVGRHQGHGLAVVGCVPRLIGLFIDNETLTDDDVACLDTTFAMPFFLGFSGPAP